MYISFSLSNFYLFSFILYFFLSSLYDIRRKSVPNLLHLIFFITGLPIFLYLNFISESCWDFSMILNLLSRFIPGTILFFISIFSKGNLGIGDAVFITVSALFIPTNYILTIVSSGFITAFFVSMCILIYGKLRCRNYHNVTLPFIPFMLPGLYFILRDIECSGGFL